ncbi:olfactory receptor 5T2-like [Tachyglossus aculeatus]|uniref:olfactory receptor 5T2-like n=1 Tax=Tachyglossus aculeatus TaxID=9261 RepID=UPI0018F536C5|nr:olfactory receptor 5T2-like [Tachyglossus aculeatus]
MILAAYVRPTSSYALEHGMLVSLFYTVVIPMMNPVIYRDWLQMRAMHYHSTVAEFDLMGFPVPGELQIILFLLFLVICLFTLVGNLETVLLIRMDSQLHNPIIYVPLIVDSHIGGILHTILHTAATFSLLSVAPIKSDIFSVISPCLSLSCSDTHTNKLFLFNFVSFIEVVTVLIVLISYGYILAAILRIRSTQERHKAFSTCTSHLEEETIYHSMILTAYVRPSSSYTLVHGMVVSLFYVIVIPLLNPLIYNLREKDVKETFKKGLKVVWFQ